MPTYRPIITTRLSTSAASITFSSIPGNYTDLLIKLSGRSTATSVASPNGARNIQVVFNDNTTAANYSQIFGGLSDTGTVMTSSFNGTQSAFILYGTCTDVNAANTFSTNEIYIANYSSTTLQKSIWYEGGAENNTFALNGGQPYSGFVNGRFAQTAAITSVSLTPDNGDWKSGTSVTLYGIKNS